MQVLITTGVSAATNSNAIYLPYDKAPVPFGDPLAATATKNSVTVITVPGYLPTNGDAVSLSVANGGLAEPSGYTNGFLTTNSANAGVIASYAQPNTTYYVSSASGATFTLGTQKASAAAPPGLLSLADTGGVAGQLFVHLLSNQVDGPTIPFKAGNTVLAMNGGNNGSTLATPSLTPITIFGTNDVSTVLATGTYGAPLGPNGSATTGWTVISTVAFSCPKLITLNYDWIVASGSSCTLVLIQN